MVLSSTNKTLLIVANTPSDNTRALRGAITQAANEATDQSLNIVTVPPLEASEQDVIASSGIILGSTENLGYLSGEVKDFFDRIYYPCLEKTQGLPVSLYIRAGHDGTGARLAAEKIMTGLRWRLVQEPLVLRGTFDSAFITRVREFGAAMATGLELGVF